MITSIATFKAYRNPRDYNGPPDASNPDVLDHMYDRIVKGRILSAPGVVNIPVCTAADAMTDCEQYSFDKFKGEGKEWLAFPCNMV